MVITVSEVIIYSLCVNTCLKYEFCLKVCVNVSELSAASVLRKSQQSGNL